MTILRRIHIGLGANLGKPQETIQIALAELASWAQAHEIHAQFRHSKLYRSTSIGAPGPDYINAVAEFNSRLGADEILAEIQNIEKRFGRTRSFPNAPRTLDLDLLLINDESVQQAHLTVPHPRISERAFVLKPLAELQPTLSLAGKPIQELLHQTEDQYCEVILESN
jgi:2-amino-4-hydroxy-6-hydroxymethyldihydropteridine diphosphokinase